MGQALVYVVIPVNLFTFKNFLVPFRDSFQLLLTSLSIGYVIKVSVKCQSYLSVISHIICEPPQSSLEI